MIHYNAKQYFLSPSKRTRDSTNSILTVNCSTVITNNICNLSELFENPNLNTNIEMPTVGQTVTKQNNRKKSHIG